MGDIMELLELMPRSGRAGSFDHLCMRTQDFVRQCSRCQKHGNINTRDAMPLTNNLQVELFDVWGIDFMGPVPKSYDSEYILVAIDYISKWVEAIPYRAADAKHAK